MRGDVLANAAFNWAPLRWNAAPQLELNSMIISLRRDRLGGLVHEYERAA
jgi:hypothetical protein